MVNFLPCKKSLLNLNKALLGFAKQTDLNYSLFIIHYSLKKSRPWKNE